MSTIGWKVIVKQTLVAYLERLGLWLLDLLPFFTVVSVILPRWLEPHHINNTSKWSRIPLIKAVHWVTWTTWQEVTQKYDIIQWNLLCSKSNSPTRVSFSEHDHWRLTLAHHFDRTWHSAPQCFFHRRPGLCQNKSNVQGIGNLLRRCINCSNAGTC